MIGQYETPYAFRMALEERLRNVSLRQGLDLQRLRRRVSFERLLARLFVDEDPPWFLKGGYALELRLARRARSTRDLDLAVPDPERLLLPTGTAVAQNRADKLHECLQLAAERDLGDGFQFLVRAPRGELPGAPGGGIRCGVEARLAGRTFTQFHVDVGVGDAMLGEPEWVERDSLLEFAGISAMRVAVVPAAQQFAEKIHAFTFPWLGRDKLWRRPSGPGLRIRSRLSYPSHPRSGRSPFARWRSSWSYRFKTWNKPMPTWKPSGGVTA